MQKWNAEPKLDNTGEGDDIERIHLYRNFIAHTKLETLSDDDFESKWLDLTVAIDRLSRGALRESICQLRNKKFEQKETVTREKYYNKEKHKGPKAEIVSKWQSHDKLFCNKIRFVQKTEEIIRRKKLVIIIGGSGCGKTSTARHCALKLQTEGWRIVPIDDAREIQSTNTKEDCVFIFDDPIGNMGLDEVKLLDLSQCNGDIHKLLDQENDHKLVITCRKIVYNEAKKHHIFDKYEVVDVDSDDNSLNINEKRELLKTYGIEELVDLMSLNRANVMFPLMCYMLSANRKKCNIDILSHKEVLDPREYLLHELDKMSETKTTRVMYASLVLLAIASNNLTDEYLKVRGLLEDIFKKCNIPERPVPKEIREKLEHSENTYVVKTEFGFTFLHDFLYEIVSFHFGRDKDNQRVFLQHVDLRYLTNNTYIGSSEYSTADQKMAIFPENYDVLCGRLVPVLSLQTISAVRLDMDISFITSILTHKCWSDDEFVNVLFSSFGQKYISQLFSKFKVVKGKPTSIEQRTRALLEERDLLWENNKLGPKGIYEVSDDGKKFRLLHWIVYNGHLTFLQKCLSKSSKLPFLKKMNEIEEEPVHFIWLSIYSMEKDMAKFVLSAMSQRQIRGCINEPFCSLHTPLTLACSLNTLDIVKILVENGAVVQKCNLNGELPLFHAVKCGSEEIIHFLLDKCPFVKTQDPRLCPFELASETGNVDILKLLLQDCSVKCTTSDGNSPLHLAIEHRFDDVAETLISRGANINAINNMKETPLHIACQKNNLNVVEVLVASLNCDTSIQNLQGCLPFHIACRNGIVPIVKLLYDSKYLNVKDKEGKTPREHAVKNSDVWKFLNRKGR
ncbi:uncharacterized protein LOC125662070 isoform X2 [Ostrea edulis]|nr:uncharacterized protein LOC125662070 isoform X2 [Ostrea edulis]XP_056003069.1 uncharacterized protein LOC125662070 isoform X2 [Ostrea edulis]